MRSNKVGIVASLAALLIVLAGCTGTTSNAADYCELPSEQQAAKLEKAQTSLTAATAVFQQKDATSSEKWKAQKQVKADQAVVDAFKQCEKKAKEEAQKAADKAALVQCRIDAAYAYMREEGFTDNEFVVGEDKVDWDAEALHEKGATAFVDDEPIATSREKLQAAFESDEPNLKAAADAHLAQDPSVKLEASQWEVIQITVDAQTAGNTGYSDGAQVAVGDTLAKAGDAQWIFVNTDTCRVLRANVDAAGNPIDPNTPEADKPVVSHRVGCGNPNNGFHKPPPPVTPPVTPPPSDGKDNSLTVDNYGWTTRGTDNELTNGQQTVDQRNSGQTSGNGGTHTVNSNTTSGSNTSSTGTDVVVGGSTSGGDNAADDVTDDELVSSDVGGNQGATCVETPLVSC